MWELLRQLKTELPGDPSHPLLYVSPKELALGSHKNIRLPLFIAALATRAKICTRGSFLPLWKTDKKPLRRERLYSTYNSSYKTPLRSWGRNSNQLVPSHSQLIAEKIIAIMPFVYAKPSSPFLHYALAPWTRKWYYHGLSFSTINNQDNSPRHAHNSTWSR